HEGAAEGRRLGSARRGAGDSRERTAGEGCVNRTPPEMAPLAAPGETLDPESWDETRALAHRMLDHMIDYVATIRERPVWQPIPDVVRAQFRESLPRAP